MATARTFAGRGVIVEPRRGIGVAPAGIGEGGGEEPIVGTLLELCRRIGFEVELCRKGEVEDWLWGWAGGLPDDVTVTVLRPAIVAGPGVDNFITRQLERPRMPTVTGHQPPLQVVHVDDVVAAFRLAATKIGRAHV